MSIKKHGQEEFIEVNSMCSCHTPTSRKHMSEILVTKSKEIIYSFSSTGKSNLLCGGGRT